MIFHPSHFIVNPTIYGFPSYFQPPQIIIAPPPPNCDISKFLEPSQLIIPPNYYGPESN